MKKKKIIFGTCLLVFIFLIISQVMAITRTIQVGDYTVEAEYDENDVEAGERFNLKITITNDDDDSKENIEFEFNEDFPYELKDDDDFNIDILNASESKSKTFRIEVDEDAKSQEYELEFTLDDSEDDHEDEFDIEVDSNQPELIIGDIDSLPSLITADSEDVQLTFSIENIGGGDAHFTRVKLELPDGFSSSDSFSDIDNLGTIKEGEGKEAKFFVDTDEILDSDIFQGELFIRYEDPNDNDQAIRLTFDIPVKARPQFNIIGVVTLPEIVPPGKDDAELRITAQNIGLDEGKETSIRVFETGDIPIEFNEKTRFIGSLKPGERGTGIFSFNIDSNAKQNDYFVKVQIRTVDEGNVFVEEKTINIKVGEREGGIGAGVFVIILLPILIIILIILIVVLMRKRPRKRKTSK